MKVVSPRWICVAKTLEQHEENRTKEYVQISEVLVKRDHETPAWWPDTKIIPGSVLCLDGTNMLDTSGMDLESPEDTPGIHIEGAASASTVTDMGCFESLVFSLARLRQEQNKQGALFECMFLLGETLG